MLINRGEFSGELPRLSGGVSSCLVRGDRGTVPVVEPGHENAWRALPAPVGRFSRA